MTTMPAAVLVDPGGAQPLRIQRVAVPEPGPTEVLIAVAAFGINNAEILQCRGVMPAPPVASPAWNAQAPWWPSAARSAHRRSATGWPL